MINQIVKQVNTIRCTEQAPIIETYYIARFTTRINDIEIEGQIDVTKDVEGLFEYLNNKLADKLI